MVSMWPCEPGPFSKLRDKIPAHFPESIGALYVNMSSTSVCATVGGAGFSLHGLSKRQQCYDDKVAILDSVLRLKCEEFGDAFSTAVIMHVRLGDAFCAKTEYVHDSLKPPSVNDVYELSRKHMHLLRPFTFIYSTHGSHNVNTVIPISL
jgi:hypothetical protein